MDKDKDAVSANAEEGAVAHMLREHVAVLGRVAMALVGDGAQVERVLEQVARDAGAQSSPHGVSPRAWLLGLVRNAAATHQSKLPLRTRTGPPEDVPPRTERLGAGDAGLARSALAALRPTEREAVVLSVVGGLAAADLAVACNVDVTTAKARLGRGLLQLLQSGSASRGAS